MKAESAKPIRTRAIRMRLLLAGDSIKNSSERCGRTPGTRQDDLAVTGETPALRVVRGKKNSRVSKKGSRFEQSKSEHSVVRRRRLGLRLAGLFHHFVNCIDDYVGTIDLNVMRAVLRNRSCSAGREVGQFLLHFLPGFIQRFSKVRRQIARRLLRIMREDSQRHVSHRSARRGFVSTLGKSLHFGYLLFRG